jgi:hypothetical protein
MGDQRRAAATRQIPCTCVLATTSVVLRADHAPAERLRTTREAFETISPLVESNTIFIDRSAEAADRRRRYFALPGAQRRAIRGVFGQGRRVVSGISLEPNA